MAGVEGQGPFLPAALYQVSCRLLGCRMANIQPGSRPYAKRGGGAPVSVSRVCNPAALTTPSTAPTPTGFVTDNKGSQPFCRLPPTTHQEMCTSMPTWPSHSHHSYIASGAPACSAEDLLGKRRHACTLNWSSDKSGKLSGTAAHHASNFHGLRRAECEACQRRYRNGRHKTQPSALRVRLPGARPARPASK